VSAGSGHPRTAWVALVLRTAAATALLVACIGVPLWLITIGGMAFAHLDPAPLWKAIVDRRAVDTHVVVAWFGRVALLMAWVAWAWIVVCVVAEVRSWRSGGSRKHLPASRTLQWMAACLVGTAFALGGVGRSPMQGHRVAVQGAGGRDPISVVQVVGTRGPTVMSDSRAKEFGSVPNPTPSSATTTSLERPSPVPGVRVLGPVIGSSLPPGPTETVPGSREVHLVAGRETLWSVAEERLGSPRRWKEIAALNYGRTQLDGARLGDDHWITPGWHLLLPPLDPRALADRPVRPHRAEVGPRFGGIEQADKVIRADWIGPPADRAPEQATPRWSDDECDSTGVSATGPPVRIGAPARQIPRTPVMPLGAGIVGVGVADLIDRLRKVQQRHRKVGTRIRLPDPKLRQFEQRLRVGAGVDVVHVVEEAVVLFHESTRGSATPFRIVGVDVSTDTVQLVLDAPYGLDPDAIGTPFRLEPGTSSVSVNRDRLLGAGDRQRRVRTDFPCPTLVTIGCTEERVVMVHPEGVGTLVISGERPDAEGMARALALELATSRWSASLDLVLVGFGATLARFDRVSSVSCAGPLIADLSWRQLRNSLSLEERGLRPSVDDRSTASVRTWDPIVVICGPDVAADEVRTLLQLGRDGNCGIAVIVVGTDANVGTDATAGGEPAYRMHAGADGIPPTVSLFGEVLDAQLVDDDDLVMVDDLLRTAVVGATASDPEPTIDLAAGDDGDGGPSGPCGTSGTSGTVATFLDGSRSITSRVEGPRSDGPHRSVSIAGGMGGDPTSPRSEIGGGAGWPEVEIAVLGTVEIRGAAREFSRAWARELVVYLAMHPGGASNDSWATALWPERVMAPSSLHSTASVARRSLGKAIDGSDHLPRSHGHLALAPSVGTDWDRFVALSDDDDTDRWREALTLVRGRPLAGVRSTDWSILDGTAPAIESAIVDLSGRLAGACLRSGDPQSAEWSARRGLLVSPYDERLYRMLLRAADAAGNPGGVESVMAELVRIVADEIEPVESVHPSTLTLYRSLSRRKVPVP
jgi:hypothetical protein